MIGLDSRRVLDSRSGRQLEETRHANHRLSSPRVRGTNTPKRPWATVPNWPPHVTGDEVVAAMDKVGVDGAIFISSFSMYPLRRQLRGGSGAPASRPHGHRQAGRSGRQNVADVVAKWKETKGAVGIRIFLREEKRAADDPGFDHICKAAVSTISAQLPVPGPRRRRPIQIIDRHSPRRFIVDHLGLQQPRGTCGARRASG